MTKRTTAPVGETTAPVGETTAPVGETTAPVGETTAPVGETTEPVGETTEPVGETTEPVGETAEPVSETTEPVGETAKPASETTTPVSAPDRFDLAALRLDQDFAATVGVKKLLTKVPVNKPHSQEFVRVHPDADRRLDTMILDLKEDREPYLVAPDLRAELFREIFPVTLY